MSWVYKFRRLQISNGIQKLIISSLYDPQTFHYLANCPSHLGKLSYATVTKIEHISGSKWERSISCLGYLSVAGSLGLDSVSLLSSLGPRLAELPDQENCSSWQQREYWNSKGLILTLIFQWRNNRLTWAFNSRARTSHMTPSTTEEAGNTIRPCTWNGESGTFAK